MTAEAHPEQRDTLTFLAKQINNLLKLPLILKGKIKYQEGCQIQSALLLLLFCKSHQLK